MQKNKQSLKRTSLNSIFLIPLLFFLILTSCQLQDEIVTDPPVVENIKNDDKKMILGEKLENPFSLTNMVEAQKVALKFRQKGMNGKHAKAFSSLNVPLSTTHMYVKFLPNSEEHMKLAENLFKNKNIVTKSHPMDQEILQYGEDYVDPETVDERFPVFYASIPINFSIPSIPNVTLESLYLPKKDQNGDLHPSGLLLEGVSRFLTGNIDENQIKEIKDNSKNLKSSVKDDLISNGIETFFFDDFLDWLIGSSYRPRGTIKVYDTNTSAYVPYKYASIEIYTWFDNAYAWADVNGRYVSPETFRFGVGVYATWRNPSATIRTSWNELLGLWVTDKLTNLGRTYNNKTTHIEVSDEHKWHKATTHLAFEKFNLFLSEKGVTTKVQDANVWVSSSSKHRGSTPMLNKYNWAVSNSLYFTSWLSWFSQVTITLGNVVTRYALVTPSTQFLLNTIKFVASKDTRASASHSLAFGVAVKSVCPE
mgnify:CR=1 FL=1